MGNKDVTKVVSEVTDALKNQAEQVAAAGASIDEVMTVADKIRQMFLDIYTKVSIRNLKN